MHGVEPAAIRRSCKVRCAANAPAFRALRAKNVGAVWRLKCAALKERIELPIKFLALVALLFGAASLRGEDTLPSAGSGGNH
jgi:hypothetical protein